MATTIRWIFIYNIDIYTIVSSIVTYTIFKYHSVSGHRQNRDPAPYCFGSKWAPGPTIDNVKSAYANKRPLNWRKKDFAKARRALIESLKYNVNGVIVMEDTHNYKPLRTTRKIAGFCGLPSRFCGLESRFFNNFLTKTLALGQF